jgi:Na+/H+ antiporter NhaD/arsenite permease-like protein
VPFIIGIAVSSNLQGAATLVGDTTAIMLGSYANMSFTDFFWYLGRPSMFFAVEIGAMVSAAILYWIFRKEKSKIENNNDLTKVTNYMPTILLCGVVVLLILASFIPNKPDITNGLITVVLLAIGIVYDLVRKIINNKKSIPVGQKATVKELFGGTGAIIINPLKSIDYETLGLLIGLFLMIGGISHMGVIDTIAGLLAQVGGDNVFLLYTIIVWGSVIVSAFIDNIPYVATMLPIISVLAANLNIDPTVLYFGLLSGATLGGNCTPIGASANITGIGILRKSGYTVKNADFFRIGIPFTLAAIIPAYIYCWLLFGV